MNVKLHKTPPYNTRYIADNNDLPQNYGKGRFMVSKRSGETFQLIVEKRKRQILEALIVGPIYSASRIRLGEAVSNLRECEVGIRTEWYTGKSGPLNVRYGVYMLTDRVIPIGGA